MVLLSILALLTICTSLVSTALATDGSVTVRDVMQTYDAVIQGKTPYTVISNDGSRIQMIFHSAVKSWDGYDFGGAKFSYMQFCVADPDADGYPELILDLVDPDGYTFGYEMLRYYNGTVYGYPFGQRAMEQITLDGDIAYSNGADDNGWYHISFKGDQIAATDICHSKSEDTLVEYYIGTTKVSRQAYSDYLDNLYAKPVPVWLPFSIDNFNSIVGKF